MTSTELGYLSGVTSNIQDQLNGKALIARGYINSYATNEGLSDCEACFVFSANLDYIPPFTGDGYSAGIMHRVGSDIFGYYMNRTTRCPYVAFYKYDGQYDDITFNTVITKYLPSDLYGSSLPSSGNNTGHIFFLKSN